MTALYLTILLLLLAAWRKTRPFAVMFLPWFLFGIIYDSMRFYPNYLVNDIDVEGLYQAEKSLFGIAASTPAELAAIADHSSTMIPGEFFLVHNCPVADFMAGLFYLCWVPVPIAFAVYLYVSGQKKWFLRFSWTFLVVNLIGFVGYYIHPASPPWYVMNYGFEPILNTPGNVAGLGRFDSMTGLSIFHALYAKNANVFAAVPSLHAAYMLVATIYAVLMRKHWAVIGLFAFICIGIWWTAVYSGHHYIIDVVLGILTALAGTALNSFLQHLRRRMISLSKYCH